MDHSDLVAELPRVEKMTAAERLKIARERRANQLRIYEQHERQFSSKSNKSMINQRTKHLRTKNRNVRFIHSVMLLEAAARNDIEEGNRYHFQYSHQSITYQTLSSWNSSAHIFFNLKTAIIFIDYYLP